MDFTHFNDQGRARMVDVTDKPPTQRTATAAGTVQMLPSTVDAIRSGGVPKGDVLAVAQVAGILAAKHTSEITRSSPCATRSRSPAWTCAFRCARTLWTLRRR